MNEGESKHNTLGNPDASQAGTHTGLAGFNFFQAVRDKEKCKKNKANDHACDNKRSHPSKDGGAKNWFNHDYFI